MRRSTHIPVRRCGRRQPPHIKTATTASQPSTLLSSPRLSPLMAPHPPTPVSLLTSCCFPCPLAPLVLCQVLPVIPPTSLPPQAISHLSCPPRMRVEGVNGWFTSNPNMHSSTTFGDAMRPKFPTFVHQTPTGPRKHAASKKSNGLDQRVFKSTHASCLL